MLGDTWPRKGKTKCLGIYVLRRSAGIVSALGNPFPLSASRA